MNTNEYVAGQERIIVKTAIATLACVRLWIAVHSRRHRTMSAVGAGTAVADLTLYTNRYLTWRRTARANIATLKRILRDVNLDTTATLHRQETP